MEFVEKVLGYLQGKEGYHLKEADRERYNNCKKLNKWIVDFGAEEAVNMCVMDLECSEAQAKKLFKQTIQIFGDSTNFTKKYLLKTAFNDIRKTMRLAEEANDLKVMAQCNKNTLTLIKDHYGDADTPDFEDIQPPQAILMYKPTLLGYEPLDKNDLEKELAKLKNPTRKRELYQDAEIIEEKRKENE